MITVNPVSDLEEIFYVFVIFIFQLPHTQTISLEHGSLVFPFPSSATRLNPTDGVRNLFWNLFAFEQLECKWNGFPFSSFITKEKNERERSDGKGNGREIERGRREREERKEREQNVLRSKGGRKKRKGKQRQA